MKRCPQCRRDYFDDTLNFCLEDGSPLIQGLSSVHSTEPPPSFDSPTLIHDTSAPDGGTSTSFVRAIANPAGNENAIAVLPFANMSRDEDAEYLSDGLAEELLNVLSRINGLRVPGRTSAFSFKGKQTTFAEIGKQLNVSSVLEGSVRTAGNRVRISVQLINVSDGYHLWSQTYDRTMDDIFAIQDDIAASVVEEVRSRLLGKEEDDPSLSRQIKVEIADAVKDRVENAEAHRLMLLGRHFALSQTPEGLRKAVESFEQALAIDPQNARCWYEMGRAQNFRAAHNFIGYAEGFESANGAAEKAISLDPDLADGHALLAHVKLVRSRDFRGADESIKRAIKATPDDSSVLSAILQVNRYLGRGEEALEMGRKILSSDPLNGPVFLSVANTAYTVGKLDEAELAARRGIEITPQGVYKHALLALILAAKGQIDEARVSAAQEPSESWALWSTALIETTAGRTSEARAALEKLIEKHREESAFQIAEVQAAMGESDEAFEYLELAFTEHDPGITEVLISGHLRALHSDARWQPLLRKIGIPEEYWPSDI